MPPRKIRSHKKRWHQKSRHGCRDCKARHVKCDEKVGGCSRCIDAGRDCGGYAENPVPRLFVPFGESQRQHHGGDDEHFACNEFFSKIAIDRSNNIFISPYTTAESQAALSFWQMLTTPESTDCHTNNSVQRFLGFYVPRVAWHAEAVRHSLLACASAALALQPERSRLSPRFRSAVAKHSIVQRQLAIRTILKQTAPSLSTVLSAFMMGTLCAWTGSFDECRRHYELCSNIIQELQAQGYTFEDGTLTSIKEVLSVIRRAPPSDSGLTKEDRVRYSCRVLRTAKGWIEAVSEQVEGKCDHSALLLVLQDCRARVMWLLWRWRKFVDMSEETMAVEVTLFNSAVQHIHHGLLVDDGPPSCDASLLTSQLTMALKFTAVYGAAGDAERLRDSALGCHSMIYQLTSMLE